MSIADSNSQVKSSPDVATRKSLEKACNVARYVIGKARQDYKCHLTDFDKYVSEKLEELTRKADDILDEKEVGAGRNILKDIQKEIRDITELVNPKLKHQPEESSQTSSETSESKGKAATAQSLQDPELPSKWPELEMELEKILEIAAQEYKLSDYNHLDGNFKNCLLCLSIFPQGAVIKKRMLIYWWIGEGFVNATADKTAEEVGEDYFSELVNGNWIDPVNNKSSSIVRECTMDPWVRWLVFYLARDEELFDLDESGTPSSFLSKSRCALLMKSSEPTFPNLGGKKHADEEGSSRRLQKVNPGEQKQSDQEGSSRVHRNLINLLSRSKDHSKISLMSVFNVDAERLSDQDLFEKLKIMKSLQVLQLGRWQTSAEHHIEFVDEESESMHKLPLPRSLRYLSLVGISRITKLPTSIRYLSQLKVLDLGNCQNLEKLGKGIIYLKSLTHLDVSHCYLLDHMPKGLGSLSQLEVLKGFIFGSSRSNDFCQLAELRKLKKLKKLSISVGSEAHVLKEDLTMLEEINGLQMLSITWGRLLRTLSAKERGELEKNWTNLRYPSSLEKLDLQCYPKGELRIEGNLQKLKKLYIRGGKVKTLDIQIKLLDREVGVNVEIVRLKFLQYLDMKWSALQKWFPNINYVEIHQCPKILNYPDEIDGDHVWINEAPSSKPVSSTPPPASTTDIPSHSSEISESPIVPAEATTVSDSPTLSDTPTVLGEATTVTDAAPVPTLETMKTDTTTNVSPHSPEIPDAPTVHSEASIVSDPLALSEAPTILPKATSVKDDAHVHSLETTKTNNTTDVPHSPEIFEAPSVPSEAITVSDPSSLSEAPTVLPEATTVKNVAFPSLETTKTATTTNVPPHPSSHSETPIVLPEAATTTDVTSVVTPGLDTKKSTATTDAAHGVPLHTSDLATSNASDQGSGAISDSLTEDTRLISVPDDTAVVNPTSLVKTTTTSPLTNSDPPALPEMPTVPTPSKESDISSMATAAASKVSDFPVVATMDNVPSHPPITPSTSSINDPIVAPNAASTTKDVAPTISPPNSASLPPPPQE